VALPLRTDVLRFREYRQAGVAALRECKDVDIAVWVAGLSSIPESRRARSKALTNPSAVAATPRDPSVFSGTHCGSERIQEERGPPGNERPLELRH